MESPPPNYALYRQLLRPGSSIEEMSRDPDMSQRLGASTFNVALLPNTFDRYMSASKSEHMRGQRTYKPPAKADDDFVLLAALVDTQAVPPQRKTWSEGAYVIIPGTPSPAGQALWYWESFTTVGILLAAIATPVTVALFPWSRLAPYWSLIIERTLDILFAFDMVVQFFIAYPLLPHIESASSYASSGWVTEPRKIAIRYCRLPTSINGYLGWFWVDFLAIVPGLVFCFEYWTNDSTIDHFSDKLAVLQCARMLRMAKTFRMWRLVRVWQIHSGVSWFALDLITFVTISLLACHWLACAWIAGAFWAKPGRQTWLDQLVELHGNPCPQEPTDSPMCMYMLASYWAVMTLTTVGYGDITPTNAVEYILCTLLMLLCGYVWAYVVGSVVNLLSNTDRHGVNFKQTLDDLNMFMEEKSLPQRLRQRVRAYFQEAKYANRLEANAKLVHKSLSPGLQMEIARCGANIHAFDSIYWAKGMEEAALLNLINYLDSCFWAPYEACIVRDNLIIIDAGFAAVKGIILRRGDAFGHENILLTNPELQENATPRSLTYLAAFSLTKENLITVASTYLSLDRRLRRAQVRVACFRKCCLLAAEKRTQRLAQRATMMFNQQDEEEGSNNSPTSLDSNKKRSSRRKPTQVHVTSIVSQRMRWSVAHSPDWQADLSSDVQHVIRRQALLTDDLLKASAAREEREVQMLERLEKIEEKMESVLKFQQTVSEREAQGTISNALAHPVSTAAGAAQGLGASTMAAAQNIGATLGRGFPQGSSSKNLGQRVSR
mmetsp:Transcript_11230/g.25755  ORF Transcript_11230/g.25755 Transcript_11230/m.25755 type:complete len:776 (+) Transcript_11230:98-2425(+)